MLNTRLTPWTVDSGIYIVENTEKDMNISVFSLTVAQSLSMRENASLALCKGNRILLNSTHKTHQLTS